MTKYDKLLHLKQKSETEVPLYNVNVKNKIDF